MMARWEEKEKRERERERERSILHVATPSVWGFTGERTRAHAHEREREARERERVREKERERGAAAAFLLLSLAGKVLTAVGQNTSAEEKDHRELLILEWLTDECCRGGRRKRDNSNNIAKLRRKKERERRGRGWSEQWIKKEVTEEVAKRSRKGLRKKHSLNKNWIGWERPRKECILFFFYCVMRQSRICLPSPLCSDLSEVQHHVVVGQQGEGGDQGRDSPIILQFFYLFSIFFLNCF
jgi:hypothetical protein